MLVQLHVVLAAGPSEEMHWGPTNAHHLHSTRAAPWNGSHVAYDCHAYSDWKEGRLGLGPGLGWLHCHKTGRS